MNKVAVFGAGSMGSGIAALLASAGCDVLLYDMSREGAQKGIDLQLKRQGFYHPSHAQRVRAASTQEDLHLLADRDWAIEAIFEDLGAKHALYKAIESHLPSHALLTSNTSTLPLDSLVTAVKNPQSFGITHFFNPPKVMKLVEVIGPISEQVTPFIEQRLGKVALACRDTPGFIANRVGCFWLAAGVAAAREHGVGFELADATFSRPFGVPRTGIFGLLDYIGLQLVAPIWGSLEAALPHDDQLFEVPLGGDPFIAGLVERGLTGRTGPGGFYRGRSEVIGADFEYQPRAQDFTDPALAAADARALMDVDSPAGRFARQTFLETLRYCCDIAPQIASTVADIDAGLKLGFGWKYGIFELADKVGHDWLKAAYGSHAPALLASAAHGFYPNPGQVLDSAGQVVELSQPAGALRLADMAKTAIVDHEAGTLWAVGHGVGVIDLHTPLNSLSIPALQFLLAAVDRAQQTGLGALVIGNDEPRAFCAGADLGTIAAAAASGDREQVHEIISYGSQTMRYLRQAPIPIVGAVRGAALGGGSELALACDHLVVHADASMGFPERHVGLFPGFAGTVGLLENLVIAGVDQPHRKAFDFIASATPAAGAFAARDEGLLTSTDAILFSADHVLGRAIEWATELAQAPAGSYAPRPNTQLPLYEGTEPLDASLPEDFTDTDRSIVAGLAAVYTGQGSLSFEQMCDKEVELDVPVLMQPANAQRAAHMAATRKPLRN